METICPACGERPPDEGFTPVERYHDPVGGEDYELKRCPRCGVVFTEPRCPAAADWYARAYARGLIERAPLGLDSWRVRTFRAHGLKGGELLDAGCGDGHFLEAARKMGFKARGFDFDAAAIAKARARGLEARVSDFDAAFADPALKGRFDVVTLFDVLEHVPEPARFLCAAKALVRPGGHLVLTMPDERRPHPGTRERLDYPPNHYTRWTPQALRAVLERQGLEVRWLDSEPLDTRYLAGQLFYGCLVPPLLPWAKQIFAEEKRGAGEAGDNASCAGPAVGTGAGRRLADAAFRVFYTASLPALWPVALGYRLAGRGLTLYALARVPR